MASKGNVVVSVTTDGVKGKKEPEAIVFVTVDTSGSMAGSKIVEVCVGLKEIIAHCPSYVRFSIRKFDEEVKTVVSKKKKYLDVDRLLSSVKSCGSRTALYDGIGQTINEIPYSCSKLDVIHVLVFTDGCDNASRKYDLESVINLLRDKITNGNIHFTFIQAGRETKVMDALQSSDLPRSKYTVLNVEDTVAGIKMGFVEAQKKIKMRFEVRVSSKSSLPDIGAIKISGLDGGAVSVQVGSSRPHPNNSFRGQPHKYVGRGRGQQNSSFQQNQTAKHAPEINQPQKFSGNSTVNPVREQTGNLPPSSNAKNNFSVWVGNIPKNASDQAVLDFFIQWGQCTLDTLGDMKDCKCAVITFKNKECSEHAVKYGHLSTFLGSTVKVLKI